MLAAFDRYVTDLEARGVQDRLGPVAARPFGASPLVSSVLLATLALLFLGEVVVVSVSPSGRDERLLSFGNALGVYYLASLPVILGLLKLLAWHRARAPDSRLWRLERAPGLTLWALAVWFWLGGFRWLVALLLALWTGSWLAAQAAAFAGTFDGAGVGALQDALARLLTVLLLYLLAWLTMIAIRRRPDRATGT